MKKILSGIKIWGIWLLFVLILFILVILFYDTIPPSTTKDSFLGDFLATVIGLFLGIPIALEINRQQQQSQEKRERESNELEQRRHKTKIIVLLKKELELNHHLLSTMVEAQAVNQNTSSIVPMKDDLWSAFSYGGELKWIDDLELLDTFSEAYYYIRCLILLEDRFCDPYYAISLTHTYTDGTSRNSYAGERIAHKTFFLRPLGLTSIEKAIAKIEQYLLINT